MLKQAEFLQTQVDAIALALLELGSLNEPLAQLAIQAKDRTEHRQQLHAAAQERKALQNRIRELEDQYPEIYLWESSNTH